MWSLRQKLWLTISCFVMAGLVCLIVCVLLLTQIDLLHSAEEGITHTNLRKSRPRKGCLLDINHDLTFRHPLILDSLKKNFLLPGKNGLTFRKGGKVYLACPGKDNFIISGSEEQEKLLECVQGKEFLSRKEGWTKPFKDFSCFDYTVPSARKTGKKCSGNYTEIEIGFNISSGFLKLINTCFDEKKRDSLYSIFNLTKTIGQSQHSVPRPGGFQDGGFYPGLYPAISTLYTKTHQLSTLAKLLKSDELAGEYVQMNDNYFFMSRGHLTSKADFLYGSQQRATFYYVNVAPQWQIFNGKNWQQLESDVRDFASNRSLDLIVTTGTWGHSSLPDINNNNVDLYLWLNKDGVNNQIKVPEIYWKVLYEPKTKAGIALIGHNNPYEKGVAGKKVCTDICDKINWLHWHASNITVGFGYCCEVDELRKTVTYLPEMDVQQILV